MGVLFIKVHFLVSNRIFRFVIWICLCLSTTILLNKLQVDMDVPSTGNVVSYLFERRILNAYRFAQGMVEIQEFLMVFQDWHWGNPIVKSLTVQSSSVKISRFYLLGHICASLFPQQWNPISSFIQISLFSATQLAVIHSGKEKFLLIRCTQMLP